ncbi:general odorant-binding protein 71 [Ceratitis capitata]|nr:general odorant-binding protein 71 [Ceratitis capitata]
MLKRSSASRAGHLGVTLLLFYFSTCCSLKCRTEDGPSESELKRITRSCMRKIGESLRPSNGGSQGYSNNYNHYGPLHQSNFGGQYGGNSRYDYNYDYDDDNDQYNGNGNSNNYNSNNNNGNNNNGNNNYDRDHDRGNRNVLQQRNRDRQQNGNSDNSRSSSSSSSSSGNNHGNGGRYDNNNGKSNGGNGGSGGGSGNNGGGGGSRNTGSGGSSGSGQRGHTQNHSNNNNNNNNSNNSNNNNRSANNDTADASCVVHCFFEELNMLNSDDYPDRYKVQYGLTRDLRDRELRNFYTDTIQDCFHYLESQRRRDKCHYSRDLINCMTEYAKVNCDDWQEFNMVFN